MKFGFILCTNYLSPDLSALYEASKTDPNIEIPLIITYAKEGEGVGSKSFFSRVLGTFRKLGFAKTISRILLRLTYIYEAKYSKIEVSPQSRNYLNILNLGIPILRVTPLFSKSGVVVRLSDEDVDTIGSEGLDVLIRGSNHILRGPILDICPYGVLGLHHGDDRKFRGSPSGFWEVYYKETMTRFMFQRLRDTLDRGDIYFRGEFPTKTSAWENSYTQHKLARAKFLSLLKEFACSSALPDIKELSSEVFAVNKMPTWLQVLKYIVRK